MKSTASTIFLCSNCDAQSTKWAGRCLECGKWGTIEESQIQSPKSKVSAAEFEPTKIQRLEDIQEGSVKRIPTGIGELDRVLGGGIVPGSLILLGGEPGIGKSTLALQLAGIIPNTLYLSGEESVGQIKMRADRLIGEKKMSPTFFETLRLANETAIESIVGTIIKEKPPLAIIDSIQTMICQDVSGESGNPNQIRAATVKLLEAAKTTGTAVIIIGHVTKEGVVAGPRMLEHLVDTVLYLEGERFHLYRVLRTVKNRFGATDEVGIFVMEGSGLAEVKNPSAACLSERSAQMSGSVLTCLMEGTRPILVEIQALVNKTAFGYPARKARGVDINRLHVLAAVLEKRAGLRLSQYDIHLNVVGGLTANEPAADLAVCLAIASSYKETALGSDLVVFGEVGLGGEVRGVTQAEKRIKESAQLGIKRIITAETKSVPTSLNIQVRGIRTIEEALIIEERTK